MGNPIAYTYDAAEHCPACAFEAHGQDEHGYVPESAIDSEGNPIGAIAPWDELHRDLVCDDCGGLIAELDYDDE